MRLDRRRAPGAKGLFDANPQPSKWVPFSLALAFVAYWVFARFLERPDFAPAVRQFWETWVPMLPLPSIFIFLAEMFHPRVLRHLLPVVLGWVLAQRAAVGLVQMLYDMPSRDAASDFLRRLQSGGQSGGTTIAVSAPKLDLDRRKSVLLRVGGPGSIKVAPGEVAVTELNGRFYRVLGAGKHNLERFEIVYAVLDLRQQERQVTAVPLVTKDGINLHTDLHLVFRIHTGGEPATPGNPFPYDEEAVRSAAYAQTVMPDNNVRGWDTLPERMARANLGQIIRTYRLDEILRLPREDEDPYHAIQQRLARELRRVLRDRGIELLSVVVSPFELPDEVVEQYVKNWQIDWEMQRRIQQADGKAVALEEMELARAEAEITMVQAIVEGVQRARREGHPADVSEIMALRLIDALEQMARQTQPAQRLPLAILPRLRSLREQIVPRPIIPPRTED